jgi:nucleoside-diphosphate-sugar epimerase
MQRVLITGATGFIGRPCLASLRERAEEVHAVARNANDLPPGVATHCVDLLDPSQTAALMAEVKPTHLLHLAWITTPKVYWTSPENLRWVEASLALLRAFADNGGRRVVMAGSCAEYDWSGGHCDEKTPLQPATLYGACKNAMRSILDAFARQVGISAAWGRVFFLYGPHEHPGRLVFSVIRQLLAGQPAPCSPGLQQRDFLHVADVAAAFVSLLASEVTGAVNIASGQTVAVRDVVKKIAEEIGRPDLLRLGALPTAEGEPLVLSASVQRLQKEVGWVPRFSLEEGLAQTIAWHRGAGCHAARGSRR